MTKYYIEVKGEKVSVGSVGQTVREYGVLREYSRVCGEGELDEVLAEVVIAVKDVADVIKVYTHEGLNNSESIKLDCEYRLLLAESAE